MPTIIIPDSIRSARGEAHPKPKRWAAVAILFAVVLSLPISWFVLGAF